MSLAISSDTPPIIGKKPYPHPCIIFRKIKIVQSGRKKAENVLERHKALTAALVKMGIERRAAEENACRVEHVITEEAFEAIKKYFEV